MPPSSNASVIPPREVPTAAEDVAALIEHWKSVPKTGVLPRLADYLDNASPRFQPDIPIADICADGKVKVRLYGTRRVKIFRSEWTGRNPLDNFAPDAAAKGFETAMTALRHPCGATADCLFDNAAGPQLTSIATILPLQGGSPDVMSFVHHLRFNDELSKDDEPIFTVGFDNVKYVDISAGLPKQR